MSNDAEKVVKLICAAREFQSKLERGGGELEFAELQLKRAHIVVLDKIDNLKERIAYLESLLRWRPVSTPPKQNGFYEVEFENGVFHDVSFYTAYSSWLISQEFVKITGWRPIPELEVKG